MFIKSLCISMTVQLDGVGSYAHKIPPLDPIPSQLIPVHNFTPDLSNTGYILILFSHPLIFLSSGVFLSGFPTIIVFAFLRSPMLSTCPIRFIIFYLNASKIQFNIILLSAPRCPLISSHYSFAFISHFPMLHVPPISSFMVKLPS